MRSRLSQFCDQVIEAGWLAALIIVPLFFNIYSQRVFEPDKLSLLRSIAVLMSVAWIVRAVEHWRLRRAEGLPQATGPSAWQRVRHTPLVLPTLLLVAVYLISTATSVVPGVSFWGSYQRLQGTYTTFSYLVIFFLMLDGLRTKKQLNRLITIAILVSFPIALYGLAQHFDLDPLPWGGNVSFRVASNMGNAIFVAAYLILIVPLTLSRLLETWKEATGDLEAKEGVAGVAAFACLVAALLMAMVLGRKEGIATWLSWMVLLFGTVLSAGICFLRPVERRTQVLAIFLPLTFAFLVGFVWVLEIPFPPMNPRYFGWGLLASLVFLVAMVPFAYYLRKPVSRVLLLAGYSIILIAQVVTIFYTQSRGPQLGLLAGMFFYLALLGLIKHQVRLSWLVSAVAIIGAILLLIFNLGQSPLLDTLRDMPYVGRLGKLLQTDTGTGKVRVLIWQGVVEMMSPHPPLEAPPDEGWSDSWNAVRPLIGYGPESMYVAYNRFYPPDLAHVERRNASPDRSHNETFDALVNTGIIGLIVYMLLFTSLFYWGFKWLGLIRTPAYGRTFLGLWLGGGLVGAAGAWMWRGPLYIGVGLPGGMILGMALFMLLLVVQATRDPELLRSLGGRYSLWMLALVAATVAHFVEIHFGIAIAATRTYFWTYAALMVVIGTRLAVQPGEEAVAKPVVVAAEPTATRRRRRTTQRPEPVERPTGDRNWLGAALVLSMAAILILGTLLFDYITIQEGNPGPWSTVWRSLTQNRGQPSPVILVLFLGTWGMIGLIGLGDLLRENGTERRLQDWISAAGLFVLITLGGVLVFAVLHAMRLRPVVITSADAPNPISHTITFYYIFAFLTILLLASVLSLVSGRPSKFWRWTGGLAEFGVVALAVILLVAAGVVIYTTNLSIIRADIIYKQGLSSEKAGHWDGAIYFYDQAVRVAPDQDFYYLFLGRAFMEKGRDSTGQERERWFQESEQALLKARRISPLNTDHSANLARLYRTWGGLSQGDRRTELLNRALDRYADATSLSPHNAGLLNEWGQTYFVLGDRARAEEMYRRSLALDRQFADTYLYLGELYLQAKEWEAAIDAYQQAIAIKPKLPEAYSAIGYIYTQKGDLDAARQAYEKAVELRPNDFNNRKNLAILYQQLGRTNDAIREATEALALAPQDQKQAIENFLVQLGQPRPGISTEEAQKIQELLSAGQQQITAQDWAAAEQTYRQVVELEPGNVLAHSALAYIYAKSGRLDEAITENLTVLSLVPGDYSSHKNLAILYQQTGQVAEAISHAEQALAVAPEADKAALQAFISQMKSLQASSTPTSAPGRAADRPPAERNQMYSAPPPMAIDPARSYRATIVTRKGNIVVQLAADQAPQTVNNFIFLAREGFYDGLTFHRVEKQSGFSLIQGGDPTGTGRGGPGYTIPAEIGLPHEKGAIAMARLPDEVNPQRASSGSQFYICLESIPFLDGAYTVFGYVVEGLNVAQSIVVGDEILTVVITEQSP